MSSCSSGVAWKMAPEAFQTPTGSSHEDHVHEAPTETVLARAALRAVALGREPSRAASGPRAPAAVIVAVLKVTLRQPTRMDTLQAGRKYVCPFQVTFWSLVQSMFERKATQFAWPGVPYTWASVFAGPRGAAFGGSLLRIAAEAAWRAAWSAVEWEYLGSEGRAYSSRATS